MTFEYATIYNTSFIWRRFLSVKIYVVKFHGAAGKLIVLVSPYSANFSTK